MRPPWLTERWIDSFIEDRAVSEDVLGDLTEEWHERSQRQAGLPLLLFTAWAGSMTSIADWAMAMFGNEGGAGGETRPLTRTAPAVWAARALVASCVFGVIGGLLLALLSRKAEMVQVTLLAALWVPGALALQMFVPEGWPAWYGLALPAVLALGTFAGGVGGVALRRDERLT